MNMTKEQIQALIDQIRADIETRKNMPEFGANPDAALARINTINETRRSFTPDTVEKLLGVIDADKELIAEQAKSIDFLKEQLAQLANFNPDWDKLEAAYDSLREHMDALTAARQRIAELEACLSNLKLDTPVVYGDGYNQGLHDGYWKARSEDEDDD